MRPASSRITNVPDIADVEIMAEVLTGLGARVVRTDHSLTVDATEITSFEAPYEMVAQMRASISVLGPLVARYGQAHVAMPGGCNIGSRKIDMHIRGLTELGVEIRTGHGYIDAIAPAGGLRAAHVVLDFPSVGATENLLTASSVARGTTVIENAAREPEIVDLVDFLNGMGARISGGGHIHPHRRRRRIAAPRRASRRRRPHRGGHLRRRRCDRRRTGHGDADSTPRISSSCWRSSSRRAATIDCAWPTASRSSGAPAASPCRRPDAARIPGFPTDMQAQFMALMAIAEGNSIITENVFENRFMFADELARMGADIRIEGHHALVKGVSQLSGGAGEVSGPAWRRGARAWRHWSPMGRPVIGDIFHIDRGYERFVEKLASLGADIDARVGARRARTLDEGTRTIMLDRAAIEAIIPHRDSVPARRPRA